MRALRNGKGVASILGVAVLAAASAHSSAAEPPADTILTHGEIYKADGGWAQALAIRRGVIVAVGDDASVQSLRGPLTHVIDLKGRTVFPGFHDMHIHPLGAGQMLRSCVLEREAKPEEIRATVAACAAKAKPGEWITGGSWVNDVFKNEPQDRKLLDEAAPNNPVLLMDETGHSSWASSMALQLAGITRDTANPLNGAIEHRPDGEPNGLLREAAARMVRSKVPAPSAEENAAALRDALQIILASGITSLQDAFASRETLTAFAILADRGELKQRVKACLGWTYNASGVDASFEELYNERGIYRRDRLEPSCVKIVDDGVPGEGHTAAMLEPYASPVPGDVGNTRRLGIMNVPADVLKKMVTRFDRDGMSMVIHCTGDACARAAVDAIAAARESNGWSGVLHQIAHNNFTTSADLQRGRKLGATFEFSAYLYYWNGVTRTYLQAIGPKRFERFKPVRATLDAGSIALEGSDWPVSPTPNPWIAIETLVTRRKPGGSAEPPLAPKEAITLKEAIDIYTINAAKQFGNADQVGSIKAGLLADLIVLDRNPFKVPLTSVHDTKVETAIINGEIVYER
jgi:predicted amidohydrolase YtcJ